MVKCLPVFEYFTVLLKNRNIIFKIRRSKVTDYAALKLSMSKIFIMLISIGNCVILQLSAIIALKRLIVCYYVQGTPLCFNVIT